MAGIRGSVAAGGMDVCVLAVCCVGTGPCDEPITSPGESYQVRVCVIKWNNNPLHLNWDTEKKRALKNVRKQHKTKRMVE